MTTFENFTNGHEINLQDTYLFGCEVAKCHHCGVVTFPGNHTVACTHFSGKPGESLGNWKMGNSLGESKKWWDLSCQEISVLSQQLLLQLFHLLVMLQFTSVVREKKFSLFSVVWCQKIAGKSRELCFYLGSDDPVIAELSMRSCPTWTKILAPPSRRWCMINDSASSACRLQTTSAKMMSWKSMLCQIRSVHSPSVTVCVALWMASFGSGTLCQQVRGFVLTLCAFVSLGNQHKNKMC